MHKHRKLLLIVLIGLITIAIASMIIFRGTTKKVYTDDLTKEGFIANLTSQFAQELDNNKSRQGIIEAYCAAMADAQGFRDTDSAGLYYDPKQSLFISILCTQTTDTSDITKNLITSYDREDAKVGGCKRDGDMTSCDMSVFIPKLFAIVMNDLSKAKLAQLYSFQGTSTDESIKAFSDTYFGPGDSICGSKNVMYLGDTQGSEKEAPCLHPQTRQILAQYIQQAQQIADQTIYIDAKKLLTPQGKNCQKTSNEFLVCAFDNANLNTTAWDSFHNVLYNELLFYKLFITLTADRLRFPEYNKFRVYSDTTTEANQETIRLIQEMQLSQDAVMYTEKTLQNMQAAFPVHIGLLAYYEDILTFRKSLLHIYTPIHQLYYKLRNVQQKQ